MQHSNRPMGVTKREPEIDFRTRPRFMALSKADWIDLYVDLYHQTMQDGAPDEEIIADAERRQQILVNYRKAEHR